MIRKRIEKDFSKYARAYAFDGNDHNKKVAYQDLRERMYSEAIRDNGIFKTFRFSEDKNNITLSYIKIETKDIELYPFMFEKQSRFKYIHLFHQTDQSIKEYQDIQESFLEYDENGKIDDKVNHEFEEIKEDIVKKHNAIYSSIKIDDVDIDEFHEIIFIHYSYNYIKDYFIDKIDSDDVIFGDARLPYGEWFIDYFSPNPADIRQRKDSIAPALSKDVYKALNKVTKDDIADNSVITANDPDEELVKCKENLIKTLKILTAQNAQLEYELEQCKEDKQVFPGYCMDCKNFEYIVRYDSNTKTTPVIDCCKHWSKADHDGNKIFAETAADGYCYMFEPKDDDTDDTTGTWTNGICDNCGYDWGKDAPTASVPEYCPKCGQKKKLSSN